VAEPEEELYDDAGTGPAGTADDELYDDAGTGPAKTVDDDDEELYDDAADTRYIQRANEGVSARALYDYEAGQLLLLLLLLSASLYFSKRGAY